LFTKINKPVEGAYACRDTFYPAWEGTHFAKIKTDLRKALKIIKKEVCLVSRKVKRDYQASYLLHDRPGNRRNAKAEVNERLLNRLLKQAQMKRD